MNHLLKLSIYWHPWHLPELVDRLFNVTSVQMTDLRRALYGHGNYSLVPPFSKFSLPHTTWQSKSVQEKDALFDDFLAFQPTGKRARTVTSADGVVTNKSRSRGSARVQSAVAAGCDALT